MSEALFDRWLFRNGTVVGTPIQSVLTVTSALQTVSTIIPPDDTIPTSSEGTELTGLSTTFTPKRVGNKIRVTVNLFFGSSAQGNVACALFRDAEAAAVTVSGATANVTYVSNLNFTYEELITSLTAITYKPFLGPNVALTLYLNGIFGGRLFGGVATSSMLIEEIQL